MNIDLTKRGILTMFFRHRWKMFFVFLSVVIATGAFLLVVTPQYSASGSLLVKFGPDATPEVNKSTSDSVDHTVSDSDRLAVLDSNVELLKSRGMLRDLVNEFGVEALYPGYTEEIEGEDSPVEATVTRIIKKDLTVKVEAQSNLITVTFWNANPELAMRFVQRLLDTFIERHADVYKKPPTEFLTEQIKEASDKLMASQDKVRTFKERHSLSSVDSELQELLKQKSDVQSAALEGLDDVEARLDNLRQKESELLNTYRPDSPMLTNVHRDIAMAQAQLRQRQEDLRSSASAREVVNDVSAGKVVTSQIAAIDHRIDSIEAQRSAYNDLVRQAQIDEDNYKTYVDRGEQARINESLHKDRLTSISVVDRPVIPVKIAFPKYSIIMLVSMLVGLVLGAWSIIMFERLDDRFTTPEQVIEELGVPVLASFGRRLQGRA
jgi:uncharacterized protein involved in exopolysaccharide biosynthesis